MIDLLFIGYNKCKKLIFLLLMNLSVFNMSAQRTIVLTNQTEEVYVGDYCGFFLDSANNAGTEIAIHAWKNDKFNFFNTQIKSFGVTKATVWCVFSVKNTTSETFYLELEKTRLDSIEIFVMQEDSSFARTYLGGNKFPLQNKPIRVNNFIYPMKGLSQKTSIYLLKFKGKYIMEFPLKIYSDSKIIEKKHVLDIYDGIYLGLIILIIAYNLFVYFILREKVHLFYSLYVFCEGSMVLYFKGFAFEFIFPSYPELNSYLTVLPTFTTITAVYFLFSFLDSKRTLPVLHKLFYVFMLIAVIGMALNFIGYDGIGMMLVEIDSFITCIAILFAGITSYRKGIKHAKLYVLAWSIFLIGVLIYVLKDFGVIPFDSITSNSIQIGSAIEIILITVALAQKMNDFKEEKERLQIISIENLIEKEKAILQKNLELESRNKEKEILLSEIHHRVKNNLAVVSGILQVQAAYNSDKEIKQILTDCTNRIKSMGLIHETLYQYENFSAINFSIYLNSLTNEIKNSYPDASKKIELKLNIDDSELELTMAIPCGLLVTEVLTNIYKHAFIGRESGSIEICFRKSKANFELSIKDNGVGLDEAKMKSNTGLGLSLIKAFSTQLNGSFTFINNAGSEFKISFPSEKVT